MNSLTNPPAEQIISWSTFLRDIEELKKKVSKLDFDSVWAVARGGLIPGTILSHWFRRPLNILFSASYSDLSHSKMDAERFKPQISKVYGLFSKPLIIDDIVDSGETMLLCRDVLGGDALSRCHLVTLYKKEGCSLNCHYVRTFRDWLTFPYER